MPELSPRYTRQSHRGGVLRKLLVAIAVVLAALALVVGYEVFLAVTSRPAVTENYSRIVHDRTLDRQRAKMGPGENQWPAFEAHMAEFVHAKQWLDEYERALPQELVVSPYGELGFEYVYEPARRAGPEAMHALARTHAIEALEHWRGAGVFERAAELATLERVANPPVDHAVLETLLPHLGLSRTLARAQAARAHLAARAGDDGQRLAALEQTLALGRQSAGQGSLIAWLVGVVIGTLAVERVLEDQLLYPVADDAWLARADAAIEREMIERFPLGRDAVMDERVAFTDIVQRVFTASGRFIPRELARLPLGTINDPPRLIAPFGDSPLSNITARLWADRDATEARLDLVYERTAEAMDAPPADAIAADAALVRARSDRPWNSIVADILMVNGPKMVRVERTRRIRAAGARVVLAIERYRLAHGRLPQTLGDLGGLLPERLRTDPFTGQPWDYQPTPTETHADGATLEPGDTPWPYTLRSRPLPGAPETRHPDTPTRGILITVPRKASNSDD